jgi:hyaluronan-mediated motility receptor
MFVCQVQEQKEELSKLRTNLEKGVADREAELAKQEELTKANHRLKGNLEQHQEQLRCLRLKTSELSLQVETSSARGKVLEAQLSCKTDEAASLTSEVARLTTSVKVKSDVLESKNCLLQEKEVRIQSLEEDIREKEQIRMREMDVLINLRAELESKESDIAHLKENTAAVDDLIKNQEDHKEALAQANTKIDDLENAIQQWKAKLSEADSVMKLMEEKLEEEEERNRGLEEMIEPFRDQLQGFELEKNSLLSENAQAHDEVKKLATQYGQLLGHQNQRQKIQHVVKIKQENVELKTEINSLRKQVAKQKQSISKLEEKLNDATGLKRFDPRLSFQTPNKNKENMTPSKGTRDTPMGPPKLGFRGRSNSSVTLGSPLRDKNY